MSDTQETIVMLKTFTLGKLLAVLENPFADSPMLQKWYTEEDLAEPAFRFCICFLACAEWTPNPYSPDIPDIDTACEVVCETASDFLGKSNVLDTEYSKEDIGSVYREAIQIFYHGHDITKISLNLGALISGDQTAIYKSQFQNYWLPLCEN